MKTRNGFVSNSSSSSFVIITTPELWKNATQQLETELGDKNMAKVIVGAYGKGKKAKVLGQDALVFSGIMSSEEFGIETIGELERSKKITEDEAELLSETAYGHMGDLENILEKDGMSFCEGEGC